ncbi:MAG: potassium-transporting ATPase subunit KdpC [Anaerolineae bacterium]|nr:potassium-transporting ATPase subunit KdpC [Anaerolineae bacterium]
MLQTFKTTLLIFVALTLVTGVLYPLAITAAALGLFPDQARGSLVSAEGQVIGSKWIGQPTRDPRYFWMRPSAVDYAPLPSGATNLGLTSEVLISQMAARAAFWRETHPTQAAEDIPADLLSASASGLDPHISPAAARFQIERVAAARQLDAAQVAELVEAAIEPPQFGLLGQARVNVLLLNRALDALE